jgi:uncharacterized protein YdeI (YjbR/CyaY-like superfamily)
LIIIVPLLAFPPMAAAQLLVVRQHPHMVMTTIPPDIAGALKAAGLADFFADCTSAHRNEYLKWIGEAKRPDTRQARITKAMRMLSDKRAEENARAKKK